MTPNLVDQIIKPIIKITKTFAFIYIQDSNNWFKGYFQLLFLPEYYFLYLTKLLCYFKVSLHYINCEISCLTTAVANCAKHVHITFDIAKQPVKIYALKRGKTIVF